MFKKIQVVFAATIKIINELYTSKLIFFMRGQRAIILQFYQKQGLQT